jgi:ElaB/YqjD/DUF883 family membrane-anchored ribosome-binding protein
MATATQSEKMTDPCRWPTMESVEDRLRQARRAANTARHAAEDAASEAALNIRRHPLTAVGAAAAVGALAGGLVGFGAGWFMRKRR